MSGTLSLKGIVPHTEGVQITPYSVATELPLGELITFLPVGRFKVVSNHATQKTLLTVISRHQKNLVRLSGPERIPYVLHLEYQELTNSQFLVNSQEAGKILISFDLPPSHETVPGTYCDTLTIKTGSGESATFLQLCGDLEK